MPGRRGSLAERLFRRVDTSGDCWLWTGPTNRKGYGYLTRGGRNTTKVLAHRASWELTQGLIPDGICVLHRCDNPACVRPAHLFLGTLADNNRDMHAKGRAWQANVTHCRKGHEYTPENRKPQGSGVGFRCRTCHNIDNRERQRQIRAARA